MTARPDDRKVLTYAAGAAVALHAAAVFLPLPEMPDPPPVDPGEQRPPLVEIDFPLPEPPRPPAPPERPVVPATRPLPVPLTIAVDLTPVAAPALEIDVPVAPVDFPARDFVDAPQLPPLPDVVEEGARGLTPPVALLQPSPEFPAMARRVRKPGRAVLRAVVDREGRVGEVEVVFVTDPDLGYSREAVAAVRRWTYEPGTIRGEAVAVRLTVVVDFDLN